MAYLIEFCCTGNSGRSTQAAVVGNAQSVTTKLGEKLFFMSSGVRAAPESDENWDYQKASTMIGKGRMLGLGSPFEHDERRYQEDAEYREKVNEHALNILRDVLRPMETAMRDASLISGGYGPYRGERTQTTARGDISLLLGMNAKHVASAGEIYDDAGMTEGHEGRPLIMTAHEYVDVPGQVKDCLGSNSPVPYIEVRKVFEELLVPQIIERFRNEHGF